MDPTSSPATWLASSPLLVAGVVLWVVGALALELAWHRRTGRRYSTEAPISVRVFLISGSLQGLASLCLIPLLSFVWPYRFNTLAMDTFWHWALCWIVVDFIYYWNSPDAPRHAPGMVFAFAPSQHA